MINCILGTRAQLVKMAPIIKAIENRGWPLNLIHTGQHYESIQQLCDEFAITSPWKKLYIGNEINTIPQAAKWLVQLLTYSLFKQTSHLVKSKSQQDIVLVHGDTFSTVLGALIGKRANMTVAHIESGLRSYNFLHPFPEEINRLVVFQLTNIAFCPGDWAFDNLQDYRRIKRINTHHNTLLDALKLALEINQSKPALLDNSPYAVCSIHRFENIYHKQQFANIIALLDEISQNHRLIFVLHPTTKKRLRKTGLISELTKIKNLQLSERMGYFDFIHLIRHSRFVITDGGSNQEELSYLGIPTLLMRKTTERQEGIGVNTVISEYDKIAVRNFLQHLDRYAVKMETPSISPSEIILKELEYFSGT